MDKQEKMDATDEKPTGKDDEKPVVNVDIPLSNEEPLLGSVTTFSTVDGNEVKGQQLRSSARVFKKMKLDSTIPAVPEKTDKKEDTKPDVKKFCRPLWTSDDKAIFFEALNEFGKDFESIQTYMATKLRKKGVPDNLIKTKDQIRHWYNRTWHKISKHLKLSDRLKKNVQELYGLINYGELRKRIGPVSEKNLLKLQELVYKGSLTLRSKGRAIRIKTPLCKALRKLNQLDEKYDEIKLPNKIIVELHPKDVLSYLKVQSNAQNPRIQTETRLQARLSSFMEYLTEKWRTIDAVTYDKALHSSYPTITNPCLPSEEECMENKSILNPPLRLTPPEGCKIELPTINLSEYLTRQSVSLHLYEKRVGIINSEYNVYNYNQYRLSKSNSKKGRLRTGSMSEKSPQKNTSNEEIDENNDSESHEAKLGEEVKSQDSQGSITALKIKNEELQNKLNKEKEAKIATIRKGWTFEDCESLTLGEIYLMFGSESKLILEYSWDKNSSTKQNKVELSPDSGVEIKTDSNEPEEEEMFIENLKKLDISTALMKLLSTAKLHYRKNVISCPCGHVCGTNTSMKKPLKKIAASNDKSCGVQTKPCTNETIFENGRRYSQNPAYLQPKVPISPAIYHQNQSKLMSQIDSIQRLKPKYCNRRGRPKSKQVVVERRLPLLPNRVESGHQIVRVNIISQDNSKTIPGSPQTISGILLNTESDKLETQCIPSTSNPLFLQESCGTDILATSLMKSQVDLELVNENTILNSAPTSPSRILKEGDNQWISSEVADYSLSSLLGHLESPIKTSSSSNLSVDDSHMSQDVDAQLQSLLTESSMDFSASFADLAAQVTQETKKV
nr:unnamed protein product [Callosobruchus chinensis]